MWCVWWAVIQASRGCTDSRDASRARGGRGRAERAVGSARSPVLRSLNTHALPPPPHYVDDADHRLKLPVCESLSVFGFAPPEGQTLPHRSTCLVWAPHNNDLVVRRNDIWICDLDISESSDKRLAATGRPDEEVTGVWVLLHPTRDAYRYPYVRPTPTK